MSRIDLHCHSTASDGSLTPTQLVQYAQQAGLTALALTDHDTLDGLVEFEAAGLEQGLTVVPGVELSVNHETGSLHLLGYGFDYRNSRLNESILKLRNSRQVRNIQIISRLNELGFRITEEDVRQVAGSGTVGRGHIGLALVKAGYFKTVEETFVDLLTRGGTAYVSRYRLGLEEAIKLLHEAGGVSVWAHPGLHEENLPRLLTFLDRWIECGLDGLESDYSQHSLELRDNLRRLAVQKGLIYTGGSDFHGELKPQISLGMSSEGESIPGHCLESLLNRLKTRPDTFPGTTS